MSKPDQIQSATRGPVERALNKPENETPTIYAPAEPLLAAYIAEISQPPDHQPDQQWLEEQQALDRAAEQEAERRERAMAAAAERAPVLLESHTAVAKDALRRAGTDPDDPKFEHLITMLVDPLGTLRALAAPAVTEVAVEEMGSA